MRICRLFSEICRLRRKICRLRREICSLQIFVRRLFFEVNECIEAITSLPSSAAITSLTSSEAIPSFTSLGAISAESAPRFCKSCICLRTRARQKKDGSLKSFRPYLDCYGVVVVGSVPSRPMTTLVLPVTSALLPPPKTSP